jgi:hypothetical protein
MVEAAAGLAGSPAIRTHVIAISPTLDGFDRVVTLGRHHDVCRAEGRYRPGVDSDSVRLFLFLSEQLLGGGG